MFNPDFYPTPDEVLDRMGINCAGKVVLEPSAGKGNIVDWLHNNGANEILACEKQPELISILKDKPCRMIGSDFLKITRDQISHIEQIVMNPPFSSATKHILHAFETAPEGCEIIALCNFDSFEFNRQRSWSELRTLVRTYGEDQELGQVFMDAERTTNVNISVVKLFKPMTGENMNYDGFFLDEEEEQPQGEGIMQYNEVRSTVNRYVGALKLFDTTIGKTNYRIEEGKNGLLLDWFGMVWCNPPFSEKEKWSRRMIDHNNGILLLPERGSAPWFGQIAEAAGHYFVMGKKVDFLGSSTSNNVGTVLFPFGYDAVKKIYESGLCGHMVSVAFFNRRQF